MSLPSHVKLLQMKKTLTANIPYAPQLEGPGLPEVANLLEEVGTRLSVESLNWPGEFPYRPLTVVSAAHSGQHIFIDFLVRCNYLRAVNYTPNSPVSEDSCVEFFVSPSPGGDAYWSFCFNCIGTIRGKYRDGDGCRFLTPGELSQIKCHASVGTRPFQEVEGSFIWSVTVAIPLALLGVEYNGTPVELKANFNKCASATSQPHYLSWAPIDSPSPDFHRPDCFAPLILE